MNLKSILSISAYLKNNNLKRPLLVTTNRSFELFFKEMLPEDLVYVKYSQYSVNPKIEDAMRGVEAFRYNKCDSIISLGGGSAIDLSKIIALFVANDELTIDNLFDKSLYRAVIPHIAIPTTAGSGSEATQFAVLYIDGVKHSLDHILLLPQCSILDPKVLMSLKPLQIAYSGIDAFCQAIESHWSIKSTEVSKRYSSVAIKKIWHNFYKAYDKDPHALKEMMLGSNCAGAAINITRTTAPHALSYPFTTLFGVPHGKAVSLSLLYFMGLALYSPDEAYLIEKAHVLRSIRSIFELTDCNNFEEFSASFDSLCKKLGLNLNLSQFKLSDSQIEQIVDLVNVDRLGNFPVKLDKKDILSFLKEDRKEV
ncbi:MAG: phosphonoacetaldehyde reductase [Bdellovibrionota bacterium]